MKRVFSIIISICIISTIGLVAFSFLRDLEPANKIYNHAYNYTQDDNTLMLNTELVDSSDLTKQVLNGTTLTDEQLSYLTNLSVTISKLNIFEYNLSLSLISENKKISRASRIMESIKNLSTLRDELLFELDVYTVKMSGVTIGDPIGTYSNIVEDVLIFLNEYNKSFSMLKDYIIKNTNYNTTKINVFDIYSNAINNLCDNYDKENLYFKNESYSTLLSLNKLIVIDNNNLETNAVGGVYSTTAYLFNEFYSKVDKMSFVQKFHLKSYEDIDITTEKQIDNLTYYYLITLLEVK